MSKRAKKRQPTQTPSEWVDLFTEHDDVLMRIRMLWRRGGGRYRPLVPVNLALEDLEALDFDEWEELEMPETHFEWATLDSEAPDDHQRRLADQARELWAVAILWTRAKGPVCDFQLRGYANGEDILFEDGKRCNLSGEYSRYDDNERERPPVDEAMRAMISDERSAWHQMDRVKDGLIGQLNDDRERLFAHLDRTTSAAPELIENARDVLERAISFQQHHFEDYMSRAGGRRELEAKAFTEYQKTKRSNMAFAFLRDAGMALAATLPLVQGLLEGMTGRASQVIPKFEKAQQALAYLHLSVIPEQLAQCFSGTAEERLERAKSIIATFDVLSQRPDESAMLIEAQPLIRSLLSTLQFQQAVSPDQVLVAQYVIGRAAMFRMGQDVYENAG